jgi:asparagine synthase (glutamine-hydrolysing)
MCGIGGIVGSPHGDLDALQGALDHRGPDGRGRWEAREPVPVRLVHTRLAILDPTDAGAQPMTSRSGRHVIVHNGEVYNFGALGRELADEGVEIRTRSDTEVLVEGWERHGPTFVDRCRGMFAFALWDRHEARLWLMRDRLGVKPLYYATLPGGAIAFASEVQALARCGAVLPRLDAEGLASFLALGAVREPATILQGVRSLPPGHRLEWHGGAHEVRRWWNAPSRTRAVPVTRREAVTAVRQSLEDAVSLRLVSDVPVSVLLSSGIDSSAIAALAARSAAGPLDAYTVRLDARDAPLDEAREAAAFAVRLGLRHREVDLRSGDLVEDVDRALAAMDQPTMDGINTWFVTRAISEHGVKVALSGLGGDEVFLGYPSARSLTRDLWSARLTAPLLRAAPAFHGAAQRLLARTPLRAWKLYDLPSMRPAVEELVAFRRALFPAVAVHMLAPRAAPPSNHRDPAHGADPWLRWAHAELGGYMANVLLRDTDVFSMAHPVEVRVPLLDHVLVERVMTLRPEWRRPGGRQKPLLVDALGEDLPMHARRGPKRGFVLPTARWLAGPLRERASSLFLDRDPWEGAGMDPSVVRVVWERFLRSPSQPVASRPWALLALGTYLSRVVGSATGG